MAKSHRITNLANKVKNVAPQLEFVAYYDSEDPMLKASMQLYGHRAFVYILAVEFGMNESFIYVGKSHFQYGRILQHMSFFEFDRVYLFECEEDELDACEQAVIRLLMPLFNRHHNPEADRYSRILGLNYDVDYHSKESILAYLTAWERYNQMGLYGFALSPYWYRILKERAEKRGRTCGQELTAVLEEMFAEEIDLSMEKEPQPLTNLVTTIQYGDMHGHSREQIKQYLHQQDRLVGLKVGRDWIIPIDEAFPEDRRCRAV